MIYKATIIINGVKTEQIFTDMRQAARWLDQENHSLDAIAFIETFDESGHKKDGFFYSEKIK